MNIRLLHGFLVLIAGGLAAAEPKRYLRPADINALPSAPADVRINYGRAPEQFGDLRLPVGSGPHPVAIVIHGGCWLGRIADLKSTAALADALRKDGIGTWNIEYRRADQAGGGWPGTFQDIGRAVDALKDIAREHPLHLQRVIVVGHSAGGHLGLWAAARPRLQADSELFTADPLKLGGVVMLGAVADLKHFEAKAQRICGENVIARLIGGSQAEFGNRYAQGSPREMLPIGVRQIFINGADDGAVTPADSQLYVDAGRSAGDTVEMHIVENTGHFEYNSPSAATWPVLRRSARVLLGME